MRLEKSRLTLVILKKKAGLTDRTIVLLSPEVPNSPVCLRGLDRFVFIFFDFVQDGRTRPLAGLLPSFSFQTVDTGTFRLSRYDAFHPRRTTDGGIKQVRPCTKQRVVVRLGRSMTRSIGFRLLIDLPSTDRLRYPAICMSQV